MSRLRRFVAGAGVYGCAVVGAAVLFAAADRQAGQAGAPPPVQGRAGAQGAPAPTPTPTPPSLAALERAAGILAEARKAMGGAALDGVKTLTASGKNEARSRQQPGPYRVRARHRIAGQVPTARTNFRPRKRIRLPSVSAATT